MALPPPSLTYLASTLYLQGAIGLGLLPNPVSGKSELQLPHAKHAIDTLQVLQEKTEGNRTPEESEEIEAMLHQLRMAFVQMNKYRGGALWSAGTCHRFPSAVAVLGPIRWKAATSRRTPRSLSSPSYAAAAWSPCGPTGPGRVGATFLTAIRLASVAGTALLVR